MVELPESAAHVATDPIRVYQLGAGGNPCHAPGAPFFSNETLPQTAPLWSVPNMLDGLRQGLVSICRLVESTIYEAHRSDDTAYDASHG
jgi:hypothetical protein